MDLLNPVLRTVLICLVGFGIAYQGRRKGYTIFNLSGRFNRLQFIILFIALMILFYIGDIIEERLIDYIVTLPAYWATRIFVGALQAMLFPLACGLFTRRIHDIGFNGWAGILWATIIIFINTYSAVTPLNYLLDLFVWIIGFLFWVLPGQPEPNKYGYPPFMSQEPIQSQPITEPPTPEEQEVRKKVRKRRKKR